MRYEVQNEGYQRATKNSVGLAVWTFVWLATLALARFGPTHLWDSLSAVTWAAIGVNVVAGIGLMAAHARYLRAIDELQRKIMMDALAITLGVGFVGGFAYVVADAADLIELDLGTAIFPMLLGVVYMAAIVVGHWKYR